MQIIVIIYAKIATLIVKNALEALLANVFNVKIHIFSILPHAIFNVLMDFSKILL